MPDNLQLSPEGIDLSVRSGCQQYADDSNTYLATQSFPARMAVVPVYRFDIVMVEESELSAFVALSNDKKFVFYQLYVLYRKKIALGISATFPTIADIDLALVTEDLMLVMDEDGLNNLTIE